MFIHSVKKRGFTERESYSFNKMSNGPSFKSLLQRCLLLGLGWVNSQLNEFSINGAHLENISKQDIARMKPISELALTIWLLKRCGVRIPVLDNIAEWAWRESNQGRYLVSLLLARNDFLPCCAFYAPLYQLGYRSNTLHAVIKMLARSDMAAVLPLQPWSRLALEYNLWKLGLSRRPSTRQTGLYIQSCPEPWVVSAEIAYAITHEVFYLSDFGFRSLQSRSVATYLRTWIPYWANAFIRDHDYDVAGELAMIWSCIGGDYNSSFGHPLMPVIEQQRENGSVPGPEGAGLFLYSNTDSPSRRSFLASYHTTLVTIMASAMELRLNN